MMKFSMVALVLLAASLCAAQAGQNQAMPPATPAALQEHSQIYTPDSLKWTPIFLPGVQMAVLAGNPDSSGPFVLRLKMPDGGQIAAHWHPTDENVTVISGSFLVGMGDKFEPAALRQMPAGSFVFLPREMRHYGKASGETVIEISGEGPFAINFVNPSDDPRNAKHQ
jgi:quercetin dioxygenase-like cupin family protein